MNTPAFKQQPLQAGGAQPADEISQASMGYVHNAERMNSMGIDASVAITEPFALHQHMPVAPHQV